MLLRVWVETQVNRYARNSEIVEKSAYFLLEVQGKSLPVAAMVV